MTDAPVQATMLVARDRPPLAPSMTPSAARRVFLSAVALALAVEPGRDAIAQVMTETVGQLPTPTGAAPVGTTIAYLTDSTRSDADFPRGRPVTLQLWYPASVARG